MGRQTVINDLNQRGPYLRKESLRDKSGRQALLRKSASLGRAGESLGGAPPGLAAPIGPLLKVMPLGGGWRDKMLKECGRTSCGANSPDYPTNVLPKNGIKSCPVKVNRRL